MSAEFFCDWDRYKEFKATMHAASFELIEIPHVRQSGKNSADIRMVVDALDLCYTKQHVDTFVIVSGDSDFSPLVSKLRENAKLVIGVGVKNSSSDLLINNCDEFIYYDDLVRADEQKRRAAKKRKEVAPGLKVLFVGINPGLYSAATGHHFARPGNRFWPALHLSGFTRRELHPSEQDQLLDNGYGITNLVNRGTATADELAPEEFVAGRRRLAAKVRRYRPRTVAVLGVGAYCHAFALKQAKVGPQPESFEGAAVWVLPNPSGLNANYQ